MYKKRIRLVAAIVLSITMVFGNPVSASELENSKAAVMEGIKEYVTEQYQDLNSSEQAELAEEIYQEKYVDPVSTIEEDDEDDEDDEEFVDVAYLNMMARENYIVDLIGSYSGVATTLDAWEYNLDFLKTHYDDIISDEDVNKLYVDRYIEDYEIVLITQDMPKSGVNKTSEPANTEDTDTVMEEIEKYVSEQYQDLNSSEQAELAEEIYQEKYVDPVSTIEEDNDKDKDEDEFVDVAYLNMMARENYIVDLIGSYSGVATTLDAWEYNLDFLKTHYDDIISDEDVNKLYVDRYIEDYEIVLITQDMPKSGVNEAGSRTASYRYADAVAYAKKYYNVYNTAYPNWASYGGDCANFISQCLHTGGKSMKGTPGSSAAAESVSNWFSKGSSCNTNNVSSTWRGANAFKLYWQKNASRYSTFSSVGSSSYNYGFVGDAVSLLNQYGNAYHTLMIIEYDAANNDFIVAGHTENTKTARLSEYTSAGGFMIYNMR